MSNEILDLLKVIESDLKDIKENTQKYNNLLLENKIKKEESILQVALEENLILENNEEMTATEWLYTKGITLDKSKRHKFAGMLAETYRSTTGKEPKKTVRISKDNKKNNGVLVYLPHEFPILQLCLNKLLMY